MRIDHLDCGTDCPTGGLLSDKRMPNPAPEPPPVPAPRDVAYPGLLLLQVDATDLDRKIFRVRQTIPVSAGGPLTLLYPKWLPGYHSPQAPIELLAGLRLTANGELLDWKRHPVEVHAFTVDVPEGSSEIVAEFEFLSPTDASQGTMVVTANLLTLQWNAVLLYPAGHFSRNIMVRPSLTLPDRWSFGCALEGKATRGNEVAFDPTRLDVLVDSPLFAGRHHRRLSLDDHGDVRLHLVADSPELLEASGEQVELHHRVIEQADLLFGGRPFDHFDILAALTGELADIGVEHHRSCEVITAPDYFSRWNENLTNRTTIPHEFAHAWNGKYRRGSDSWTPTFERPIRNSLLWVYEGQTQYWTFVLTARSGLWSAELTREAIALCAATQDIRTGGRWRPMCDTTRDPIIAARNPLPWPSWQRSEDYYLEGALIWLDVDTRLRELTGETRSLDDFARSFFSAPSAGVETSTYDFDDVVNCLEELAPFDWRGLLNERLLGREEKAPLDGIVRGGYRLVYREKPSSYSASLEAASGSIDLGFSLGLKVSTKGAISEVIWEGPAYQAGLTSGPRIVRVNEGEFSADALKHAVAASAGGPPVALEIESGKTRRTVEIDYAGGLRFPHLAPIAGARPRLDEILAPA
jgi:predicted metalloprotease with PDZ domain